VREQAEHIGDELRTVLAAAGCTLAELVSLDVFLVRAADADTVAQALRQALGSTRVAGSVVVVTGLAVSGALVEVDAVALLP
jgi:enamine deaminase RidA (YjgF/YER057c/UK114 family)